MLFGAAGRIRTADLILTKKPWLLLWRTHSYRGRTFNPLCYKGLKVLLVLVRFSRYWGVLRGFSVFVGRIVGKRVTSVDAQVLTYSSNLSLAASVPVIMHVGFEVISAIYLTALHSREYDSCIFRRKFYAVSKGVYILLCYDTLRSVDGQFLIPCITSPIDPQIFLTTLLHVPKMMIPCK